MTGTDDRHRGARRGATQSNNGLESVFVFLGDFSGAFNHAGANSGVRSELDSAGRNAVRHEGWEAIKKAFQSIRATYGCFVLHCYLLFQESPLLARYRVSQS